MSEQAQAGGKRIWVLSAIAVFVAVVLAAFFWRGSLMGETAEWFVQRHFGIGAHFKIGDIDLSGVWLPELSLGDDGELRLKDVRIDYRPSNFGLSDIKAIQIGEAEIQARYDGGFHLGSLDSALAELTHSDTDGSSIHPMVVVHHIRVHLATPIGEQQIDGMATYDKDTLFTNLNWIEAENGAHLTTTATIRSISTQARPEGQIQGSITAQSKLWQLLPGVTPVAGQISVNISVTGGSGDPAAPRLQANLALQNFSVKELPEPINGPINAVVQMAGGEKMPQQLSGGSFSFNGLTADIKGGPSVDFVGKLGNGQGTLGFAEGKTTLTSDIDLAVKDQQAVLGDVTLKEPAADLKLRLNYDGAIVTVTPRETGKLTIRDLPKGPIGFPSGLTVPVKAEGTELAIAVAPTTMAPIAGKFALGDIKTQVAAAGRKDIATLTLSGSKAAFGGETADSREAQLVIPTLRLDFLGRPTTIGNLQIDAKGKPDLVTGTVSVSLATIDLGKMVAPLKATAKLTGKPGRIDMTAKLTDQTGRLTFTTSGNMDPGRGTGRFQVNLAPLVFAKDGWQFGDLIPIVRQYSHDIDGKIALKGTIDLAPDRSLTSKLNLAIENLSGQIGPAVFQNLNGVVLIDRPWPLSTAANQTLSVEQLVIGLPFTNGLINFDIDDGRSLKVNAGSLNLAGGQVSLAPTQLALDASVQQLDLQVDRLGVGELFQLIGIAGLSGEGQISGNIPVSLFPTGVVIKDAKLASVGPGKLKYDKASAPAMVKSAGSSVNMALDALSDFHYKELILTLQRELTGDANLGLHISGSNPSFYDGYPVEFNFTATGRLDEVLRKGLAGYQVPAMIEQRLNDFR
ncbi:YdbH domain-containing protein [Dongia soli]|uniref:YdbH domain-containing protein n=1 Tax=Dongia soli TaxID=600628 RepID=A0ABU5E8L7_9PROT|nr:YdbH domain-containing protein [Dongia soli]MDY0882506.1 YdbH domain-containing protein [Dongia soli]